MRKLTFFLTTMLFLSACTSSNPVTPPANTKSDTNSSSGTATNLTKAVMMTNKGKIVLELKAKEAPLSVANFQKLVREKFYDGLTFHRVESWVIQTGDPTATGGGGSKETVKIEIACEDGKTYTGQMPPSNCKPVLKHTRGAVGVARTPDPNSGTSQFYIVLDAVSALDGQYAVFGYVTEGMDIAQNIQRGDTVQSITLE